jgi:iron complex transport system substrate-binding protein
VIIHIPVSRVVCLSTTHCAFINLLGKSSSIKGMSGIDYVYNDDIRYLIQKEEIIEIGSENQIDYERIIALNPDVVFAYGIDNSSIASYQKLSEIGIPVVFVGDFLESHPLGRTEWLKFFSCFYNQLDFANEYFDSVSTNYENISKEIKSMNLEKPNVLVSLPWKGTWWIPGGKSFFAQLINDAGGSYILKNDTSSESVPMTIEEIFNLSKGIKIWLNPNSYNQKRQILEADSRLKDFSPYLNARIFNNNKRTSNYGGNDFWESGIIHPDIILQDLRKIFNPEQTPEYNLFYYKELQ